VACRSLLSGHLTRGRPKAKSPSHDPLSLRRVQQLLARTDSVGDRDEMLVKFASCDRVEQLAVGVLEAAILKLGPQHRPPDVAGPGTHVPLLAPFRTLQLAQ